MLTVMANLPSLHMVNIVYVNYWLLISYLRNG